MKLACNFNIFYVEVWSKDGINVHRNMLAIFLSSHSHINKQL